MPVRKHYECNYTLNRLFVSLFDSQSDFSLKVIDENNTEIQIILTRYDLIDLIEELESLNEFLYEKEKGGTNG